MKNFSVIFFVCLSAKVLASNWVEVVGTADSSYIDVDNITKDSGYVFYSSMSNMSSMGLNSVIIESKADCSEKKVIELAKTFYGQTMGRGIKYEEENSEKTEFYPENGSTEHRIMKFACQHLE